MRALGPRRGTAWEGTHVAHTRAVLRARRPRSGAGSFNLGRLGKDPLGRLWAGAHSDVGPRFQTRTAYLRRRWGGRVSVRGGPSGKPREGRAGAGVTDE